jgi:hypothetical protein
MVGGGLVAQGLRVVRVPDSWAFPLGFTLAAAGSLYLFLGNRRLDIRERADREADIESLRTGGSARTYHVSAEKAWEVTDYDHGPAYLLRVEPTRFIFISSFSPHIETMGDLRREVTITVAEPVGLVLSASTGGPTVSIEPENLEPEDVSDARGRPADFALFSADELPESWRLRVASAA